MSFCDGCGQEKPADQFYRQRNKASGRMSKCKTCVNARHVSWKAENMEQWRRLNNAATRAKRKRSPVRQIIYMARARAKAKGIAFDLTEADVVIPEFCPVLGIRLQHYLGDGDGRRRPNSPSLDRIDNSKGYVRENVIIISWRANRLKNDATLAEIQKIAGFYGRLEAAARGQTDVSSMQPYEEEETGTLLVSVGGR